MFVVCRWLFVLLLYVVRDLLFAVGWLLGAVCCVLMFDCAVRCAIACCVMLLLLLSAVWRLVSIVVIC